MAQVRNVILRALQQSQIDKAAAAAKTHEAAAKAAQVAVERVFEHCLQVAHSSSSVALHAWFHASRQYGKLVTAVSSIL